MVPTGQQMSIREQMVWQADSCVPFGQQAGNPRPPPEVSQYSPGAQHESAQVSSDGQQRKVSGWARSLWQTVPAAQQDWALPESSKHVWLAGQHTPPTQKLSSAQHTAASAPEHKRDGSPPHARQALTQRPRAAPTYLRQ